MVEWRNGFTHFELYELEWDATAALSQGGNSRSHRIRAWISPGASQNDVTKGMILSCWESNLGHSAVVSGLCYPGFS